MQNPITVGKVGQTKILTGLCDNTFQMILTLTKLLKQLFNNYVENKLNNRPRKRFGGLTPNQVHLQLINKKGQVAFIS